MWRTLHGSVLDVGCGTGDVTLVVARQLGTSAHCVGVDISETMIAATRARAEREDVFASFICADAQRCIFEPASFDMIMSRFGVMFFGEPVRAFANRLSAAREGPELRFITWRSVEENPFMTVVERAAALLPNLSARRPDAPAQFAFADQHSVSSIFQKSGWAEIDIRLIGVECTLSPDIARFHSLVTHAIFGFGLYGAGWMANWLSMFRQRTLPTASNALSHRVAACGRRNWHAV